MIPHIRPSDSSYPSSLKEIAEIPQQLWYQGDLSLLQEENKVAIVGARECTAYGQKVALDLAKGLAEAGVVVVSGMAFGVDVAAHKGTLDVGGKTIAVLGCGVSVPYPKGNLDVKKRIIEKGLVMSEYPPEMEAAPWTFPRRNRIISGISRAVVVVEATLKSGSLITARWALDQGRDVFAVPGNITSPMSEGTNKLIQEGAKPVLKVEDILDELKFAAPLSKKAAVQKHFTKEEEKILSLLSNGEQHMDELSESSGYSVPELSGLLVALEMQGSVRALPGSRFMKGEC